MWPVPSPSTPFLVAAINSSAFVDPNSFSKAGRKIHVGDCALFKLPNGPPPSVGIIRKLIVGKEENLSLSVNWFYRPADIKLVKGALLEAAPNEVFYSFHKDEIPAASLLHPCKVAFLRKGVELPSGISSFVCRRVYDIDNKCLWWLTDQNYINQRQEIDKLLDKTEAEMHGAVHTGGRSPKPSNTPNGTTQLKPSSDNIQNKSKKRENSIHSPDSLKRECLSKTAEAEAGEHRPEHVLKSEIAKFTDKGGLVDFEGVEKLIQLMQPESAEKKVDLACRVMLVDVISVTDRFDCLGKFVQRRGLHVLDEWLQEVHKGKIGDVSPKGNDKSIEEFLFALLRALDRLPVNLLALQTCNVGKSVNHLRSHKNSEIQKKARSLVDTWKKRVEAEMNIIETRSGTRRGGSWANKSMMPEVSHRRVSGSSDVDPKVSTSQPSASRSQAIARSPESSGSAKLAAPSDMPLVSIKEEKSGSSSPRVNNSQSCSSDHGKTGSSCREDAPSPTSGSLNKISSGMSHSRKSSNVVQGSTVSAGQKEGLFGKFSSVNRNFASGKGSPIRATPERVADVSSVDNMNNQRLIVKLPNTGRSLAHTASGVSLEDTPTTSGKSQLVRDVPQTNNVVAIDTDLCQGKEGLVGSDEVKMEIANDGETVEKLTEPCKGNGSANASEVPLKAGKLYETSYSSVNVLVESCAKFSEANVSAPAGDDVGMNLLASVAAGEMSRSDVSPVGSSENKPPVPEDTCSGNDAKLRQSIEDGCQSEDKEKTGECNEQCLPQSGNAVFTTADVKPAVDGCKEGDERKKLSPNWSRSYHDPNLKPNNRSPSEEDKNASEKALGKADAAGASVKVETQVNDESASCSSSDKHEDEKKVVRKQSSSSNLVLKKEAGKDSELQSTACGLGPKVEETDNKSEQMEKPNRDSDLSVKENKDNKEVVPPSEKSPVDGQDDKHTDVADGGSSEGTAVRLDFDLNEVLPGDDGIQGDIERRFSTVHTPYQLPSMSSLLSGNRPASITVAAAAKGPFYHSENLIRGKTEIGWRGSAATSAFRPAEPRKVIDVSVSDHHSSKNARPLFDFDLNVGVMDDVNQNNASSSGGLGLDLNSCEDSPDVGQLSVSFGRQLPQRSSLPSGRLSNSEVNHSIGFDLNSGPGVEENGSESLPLSSNGMQFLSAVPSVRMNNMNMEMGNMSSWFPQSSTYPAIAIPPTMVPGAAAASQRMLTPEMFRGPVLSSSPAVAFPSTMPFQFPGFPFETNFPVTSNTVSTSYAGGGSSGGPLCFPTIPSQLVGPSGVVSSPYRPPFMMSTPNHVGPDGRRWGNQGGGLDLNAGPGGTDLERRDETLRHMFPLGGPQGVSEEQLKLFQQMAVAAAGGGGGGGVLKRKEPDDGWDADRISYKHHHPSWQ